MSLAAFTWTDRVRPVVELGVGDSRIPTGHAVWDVARWDDPAALWAGDEPTWRDITCDVRAVRFEYGRRATTDRYVAGVATVVVDNATGWADPNVSVDPAVLAVRPGRALRVGFVHATLGTFWRFRGFVDVVRPTYDPVDTDTVELECIDALGEVNRAKLQPVAPPVGDGEETSDRVDRILDAALWSDVKRDVRRVPVTLAGTDLGGQVADLLGRTADSAGASVFGDYDGNIALRYNDWQTFMPGTPPDATIGNVEKGHTIPGTPGVDGWLTPTVGTVTTPSAGALPNDCVWVMKLRGPSNASGAPGIAGYGADAQQAWAIRRNAPTQGDFNVSLSSDGVGLVITRAIGSGAHPVTGADEWLALSTTLNSGGRWYLGTARSTDGVTWTTVAPRTDVAAAVTVFAPTAEMRIGSAAGGTFTGRIYSVELREGLDPAATTVPGYLTPTVGTVSTPDPGPLPDQCTFVFTVRGPQADAGAKTMAFQWGDPQSSFLLYRDAGPSGAVGWIPSPTGSGGALEWIPAAPTDKVNPQTVALSIGQSTGLRRTHRYANGVWSVLSSTTGPVGALFDSALPVQIGGPDYDDRIYSVELRTGLDPAAGTVVWRFDANDYPGTGTSYVDPRGRTWTLTTASAITPKRSNLIWRFDANDYPGTGTSYVDPRGRTWTLTTAAAITPKVPAVPEVVVPPDVCPSGWERPFARADIATRVIVGRDAVTATVLDDTTGQTLYGIEPFERTDLLTVRDDVLAELADRILRTRDSTTAPRVRSVLLDARTSDEALDLMTTVDVYKPSRYRCRLRYPRGDVFDAEHFATGVVHEITPKAWSLALSLDLAAPYAAAGARWDQATWDTTTWGGTVTLADTLAELDDLAAAIRIALQEAS